MIFGSKLLNYIYIISLIFLQFYSRKLKKSRRYYYGHQNFNIIIIYNVKKSKIYYELNREEIRSINIHFSICEISLFPMSGF